nr:site-specific integrase [Acidiferrobacter sp.]
MQAEAWARQIEGEMDRGVFVSRAEAENTTLADALDRYAAEVSPTKKTANREIYTIRWWQASALGPRSLASIRGKDITAVLAAKEAEGAAPHTIHLYLALLSHLFTMARRAWGMEGLSNPTEFVRKPKLPQGRDRRLVDDEPARLLTTAATYGGEIGPLITWAIETAMRRGEIAAMRWEHIDRKDRVLLIPETKNGTPRQVPLSTVALQALDSLPRRLDGLVWNMRPDSISQAFERVCKAAGIEGLTFHDLRHEATSRLFEKGLNPMEVAAITGHKTLQMLKRYTHLKAKDLVGRLG